MKHFLVFLLTFATMALATGPEPTHYDGGLRSDQFGVGYYIVSPSIPASPNQYNTTLNVTPTMSYVILNLAQAMTTATLNVVISSVNRGVSMFDGQVFSIVPVYGVTTISVTSTSALKGTAATSLTAGTAIRYLFNKVSNFFYRTD